MVEAAQYTAATFVAAWSTGPPWYEILNLGAQYCLDNLINRLYVVK